MPAAPGSDEPGGFLSRWARRKEQVRIGEVVAPEPVAVALPAPALSTSALPAPALPTPALSSAVAAPASSAANAPALAVEARAEPLPTMADVALLTRESDYSRFVAPGIDEGVKQAAMKKLFSDPHFNVMDGLDTYIDDYGKPDPIPLAMLRQMNQSKFLRLFDDETSDSESDAAGGEPHVPLAAPAALTDPKAPPDDDPDLQLQQDDAAGRSGADQGARA